MKYVNISGAVAARIEFLAPTWDNQGEIIHYPGEIVIGELLTQKHDFLLVRTASGGHMFVDTSRQDLHTVELSRTGG